MCKESSTIAQWFDKQLQLKRLIVRVRKRDLNSRGRISLRLAPPRQRLQLLPHAIEDGAASWNNKDRKNSASWWEKVSSGASCSSKSYKSSNLPWKAKRESRCKLIQHLVTLTMLIQENLLHQSLWKLPHILHRVRFTKMYNKTKICRQISHTYRTW